MRFVFVNTVNKAGLEGPYVIIGCDTLCHSKKKTLHVLLVHTGPVCICYVVNESHWPLVYIIFEIPPPLRVGYKAIVHVNQYFSFLTGMLVFMSGALAKPSFCTLTTDVGLPSTSSVEVTGWHSFSRVDRLLLHFNTPVGKL